jgi:sugar porter (SP) family MFS transporter
MQLNWQKSLENISSNKLWFTYFNHKIKLGNKKQIMNKTTYVYLITLVASMGGFMFGYDIVVIAGALPYLSVDFHLTPFMTGVAVSSAYVGSIFGPILGLWFSESIGRRNTMLAACLFFTLSTVGTSLSGGVWWFSLWRFMGGMGIGLAMISSPIYIAELAPAEKRGTLVNINQLSNVIGINLAVIVSFLLSNSEHNWRLMFATQGIPILLLLVGLILIPESPRWLAAHNRSSRAFDVLAKINGRSQAEIELKEIEEELQKEKGGFRELFEPGIRLALFVGVVMMVLSQINGVNLMLLYAPTILNQAGIHFGSNAILSSVPIYLMILVSTIVAFPLIKKFSRRGLVMTSIALMAFGHLLMAITLEMGWPPLMTLIPMIIGTSSFTFGFAPLSWIILAEIFPNRIRGIASAFVCFFLYIGSFVVTLLFPPLTKWFQAHHVPGYVYLIFACICLSGLMFMWKKLPETKGISLEKIGDFWIDRSITNNNNKNLSNIHYQ